jgi:hypothetical protein
MDERVRPFSNATEYQIWLAKNCESCKKNVKRVGDEYISQCDIEEALSIGAITDGKVPKDIYERMGDPLEFECPEWEKA